RFPPFKSCDEKRLPRGFGAISAPPLRAHEPEKRHWHDALPADGAASLYSHAEDFWIKEPRRGVRPGSARENGAFACPPARRHADDCRDQGDHSKHGGHNQSGEYPAEINREPSESTHAKKSESAKQGRRHDRH